MQAHSSEAGLQLCADKIPSELGNSFLRASKHRMQMSTLKPQYILTAVQRWNRFTYAGLPVRCPPLKPVGPLSLTMKRFQIFRAVSIHELEKSNDIKRSLDCHQRAEEHPQIQG
jgi:hypothetical protein